MTLGVTLRGEKVLLGFVQTATENRKVCPAFLRKLVSRAVLSEGGLLVVIDGSKGLRGAFQDAFGAAAQVQRCQWHKRENVVAYLPKAQQAAWRTRLQRAHEQPTYARPKPRYRFLLQLRVALQQTIAKKVTAA